MAATKEGSDIPKIERTRAVLSAIPPLFIADTMPSNMPRMVAMIIALMASTAVPGNPSAITSVTLRRVW